MAGPLNQAESGTGLKREGAHRALRPVRIPLGAVKRRRGGVELAALDLCPGHCAQAAGRNCSHPYRVASIACCASTTASASRPV